MDQYFSDLMPWQVHEIIVYIQYMHSIYIVVYKCEGSQCYISKLSWYTSRMLDQLYVVPPLMFLCLHIASPVPFSGIDKGYKGVANSFTSH